MIVWADKEKFARWEKFLPVPKIRLRRERLGDDGAVPPSAHPPNDPSSSIAGTHAEEVPVSSEFPDVPTASDFPLDVDQLVPSLGSDWSGFEDELAGPFSDLPPVELPAPSRATLNPSQNWARSPVPPSLLEQDARFFLSPHPAADGGQPGIMADQVASLRLLIQSCLRLPLLRLRLLLLLGKRYCRQRTLLSLGVSGHFGCGH